MGDNKTMAVVLSTATRTTCQASLRQLSRLTEQSTSLDMKYCFNQLEQLMCLYDNVVAFGTESLMLQEFNKSGKLDELLGIDSSAEDLADLYSGSILKKIVEAVIKVCKIIGDYIMRFIAWCKRVGAIYKASDMNAKAVAYYSALDGFKDKLPSGMSVEVCKFDQLKLKIETLHLICERTYVIKDQLDLFKHKDACFGWLTDEFNKDNIRALGLDISKDADTIKLTYSELPKSMTTFDTSMWSMKENFDIKKSGNVVGLATGLIHIDIGRMADLANIITKYLRDTQYALRSSQGLSRDQVEELQNQIKCVSVVINYINNVSTSCVKTMYELLTGIKDCNNTMVDNLTVNNPISKAISPRQM